MNNRRKFLVALGIGAFGAPWVSLAQQQRVYRIGYLANSNRGSTTFTAFVRALEELGWTEGRNIEISYRTSGGRDEAFSAAAAEFVHEKVDIIVTTGSSSTKAAIGATDRIPIVFGSAANPVEQKFVESLARPGGNVTGLALLIQEVGPKRLQLLKEILPRARRFARLYSSTNLVAMQPALMREYDAAARTLGITLNHMAVQRPEEIETVMAAAAKRRVDGVIVEPEAIFVPNRARIAALGLKHRLPLMCADGRYAEAGALASYGENFPSRYRRAAALVDKILRGTRPAEIPVEQPTNFELVINLQTAKVFGVRIPHSVLLRADRTIE